MEIEVERLLEANIECLLIQLIACQALVNQRAKKKYNIESRDSTTLSTITGQLIVKISSHILSEYINEI